MNIVIASGKGGTGKTTVATNLAWLLADEGRSVRYLDCDVEEPNGHIFLKPQISKTEKVSVAVPVVDENRCTYCGRCSRLCQYGAIAVLKESTLIFEALCHSCGGCRLVCPEQAIDEKPVEIGVIEQGRSGGVEFVQGRLNVGDVRTVAMIKQVKSKIKKSGPIAIIDAPPGTSCPVIESVKDADHLLLVTEPTPFGLNDLVLAVEMARVLKLSFSVIINRSDVGDKRVHTYCEQQQIPIAMELPNDRRIARAYSSGQMILEALSEYQPQYRQLIVRLEEKQ